jgi:hypothetical protein
MTRYIYPQLENRRICLIVIYSCATRYKCRHVKVPKKTALSLSPHTISKRPPSALQIYKFYTGTGSAFVYRHLQARDPTKNLERQS